MSFAIRMQLRKDAHEEVKGMIHETMEAQGIPRHKAIVCGYCSKNHEWIEIYPSQIMRLIEFKILSQTIGEVAAYVGLEEAIIIHELGHLDGWRH